jgi:hypothetical protein
MPVSKGQMWTGFLLLPLYFNNSEPGIVTHRLSQHLKGWGGELQVKDQHGLYNKTLSQKKKQKWATHGVTHLKSPSYSGGKIRRITVWGRLDKVTAKLYLKTKEKKKKTGDIAQAVQCLASKCKSLSSIPSAEKKKLIRGLGTHFSSSRVLVSQAWNPGFNPWHWNKSKALGILEQWGRGCFWENFKKKKKAEEEEEAWGHGSNDEVSAYQGKGPEFKPQFLKKKKECVWISNS